MLTSSKTGNWLTFLVAAVPGLTVFTTGWGVPWESRALFAAILEITAFGVLALLILFKPGIRKWSKRRVGRHLAGSAGLAMALLTAYSLLHQMTVFPTYYQPEKPEYVFIPWPANAWANDEIRYDVACAAQPNMAECAPPKPGFKVHAADVARAITVFGSTQVHIPAHGAGTAEFVALVLLYALIVGALIWLYGVAMIRRIDVAAFVKKYAAEEEKPA
jgi:hypothetical protein